MDASSDVAVSSPVAKVFDKEALLEQILKYAIFGYKKNERVSQRNWKRNACTLRLVCNSWLQSISGLLGELNEPLLHFNQDHLHGGRVQNFVESVSGNAQLYQCVPPFSLWTTCRLSRAAEQRIFLDCLATCGSGLLQLKLDLQGETDTCFRREQSSIKLPKLQSLTVSVGFDRSTFAVAPRTSGRARRTPAVVGRPFAVTAQNIQDIQRILDASKYLKSFDLSCDGSFIPGTTKNLNSLKLPSALTLLNIGCEKGNCTVDEILKNPPPTLKTLQLAVHPKSFQNGALTCCLEKVRETLETLEVRGEPSVYRSVHPETFRLPCMTKLKRLCIDTPYLKLEEHPSCLSHVTLTLQLVSSFRKWGKNSRFESVSSLTASLVANHTSDAYRLPRMTSFDSETMTNLKATFPNLVELDICFFAGKLDKSAFATMMELTKLRRLEIRIKDSDEIQSSNAFDALFLGIPEESVEALRTSPKVWDDIPEDQRTTSIRNLTDLESLSLGSNFWSRHDIEYISDLSFKFAFLKMPQLTRLTLDPPFSVSKLMAQRWRKQRRTITTTTQVPARPQRLCGGAVSTRFHSYIGNLFANERTSLP